MSNLSLFTPSNESRETLEALFVGESRRQLLDDICDRATSAIRTPERNHTLIVGPRGAGKTHLVSLAHHRIGDLISNGGRLQLSWPSEEAWFTIDSYAELLTQIVEWLQPSYADLTPRRDAPALEALLSRRADEHGPIVVVLENFDQILSGIGTEGQQTLRSFLANHRALLLICTTTSLTRDLTQQDSPFYAYFTTNSLQPFDTDEAAEMLKAIARLQNNEQTEAYLDTETGRARLRAIAHLAGGQPRMWATFGRSLTVSQLDELVDTFLTRFDELTPYYQQQLERLSPQKRRIVSHLSRADHPTSVKELAAALAIDQRSVAAALSQLTDAGWLQPVSSPLLAMLDGRLAFYDLSEPLARVVFQLKEARGAPIATIVDFIKCWFEPHLHSSAAVEGAQSGSRYLEIAKADFATDSTTAVALQLRGLSASRGVAKVALLAKIDSALRALDDGDAEPMFRLPTQVRRAVEELFDTRQESIIGVAMTVHGLARTEFGDVPHPDMEFWENSASHLAAVSDGDAAVPLANLANWQASRWDFPAAARSIAENERVLGPDHPDTLASRGNLASSYWSAGRTDEAITLEEAVLADRERILGLDHPDTLTVRANLAVSYGTAGRTDEAITLNEAVLADRERILGLDHPDTLTVRGNLGYIYRVAGRTDEAITLEEAVLADSERILGLDHPDTLTGRGNLGCSYRVAGRTNEAITLNEAVLADSERILGLEHPDTLTVRANLAASYWTAGRTDEAVALEEAVLADRERILGLEHPDTLGSRTNLAVSCLAAGQIDEAITLHEAVLTDRERILGPEHPSTLTSRANLAASYRAARRTDEAIAIEEAVLADRERILGLEHPSTLTSRANLATGYRAAGRIDEAIALEEGALTDRD